MFDECDSEVIQWARVSLAVLLSFCALSAFGGGVLGVAANGAGVPLEYLDGTPFSSYLIPGLILGTVIGGTQALGAVVVVRKHPSAPVVAPVAGFGMIIWLFVELAFTGYSWLQTVYLILALAEILLVLVLAGVANPPYRATHDRASHQPG